jgi:hypothetical protein
LGARGSDTGSENGKESLRETGDVLTASDQSKFGRANREGPKQRDLNAVGDSGKARRCRVP